MSAERSCSLTTLLADFVGLEVVLEMNPWLERPIGLLRLVLEVDLGKSQTHVLRGRLVTGTAMCDAGDDDVIHLDDEVFLLTLTGFPMGDCRVLQMRTRGTRFHEKRRRLVDMVNDGKVVEGRLP